MDTISRQAAIDAICTWDKFGVDARCRVVPWHEGLEPYVHLRDVVTVIVNLPSAEPQREIGKGAIMGRTIDENSVIDIVTYECGEWSGLAKEIEKQIRALPSVQPELKRGKWINGDEDRI